MTSESDFFNPETIGYTICIATIIVAFLIKTPKMKVPVPGIPMVPDSHWLFGHSHILIRDFKESWWKLCYQHANAEGMCSFWNLSRPAITVNTVENARTILAATSSKPALGHMRKHLRVLLGDKSLPFLNGKDWKYHRSMYAKALSSKAVCTMLEPIRDVVKSLVIAIEDKIDNENQGEPIQMNIETLIQLALADINGKTFFGMEFNCCEKLQQIPITRAIKFLVDEISRRITSPLSPAARFYTLPTARNRRHRENIQLVRNTLKDIIKERKLALSSSPSSSSPKNIDFITTLLKTFGADEFGNIENVDVDEVIDSLLTAHMASFDSSTSTLVYIFYCMSVHPEAKQNCLEEIQMALNKDPTSLEPDDLPYCNAVITETIRLYPAFVAISRTLEKSLTIDNVTIPTGMDVLIPFWYIQRDERNFPRALEFLPERWVERTNSGSWVERPSRSNDVKEDNVMKEDETSLSSDDNTLLESHPEDEMSTTSVDGNNTMDFDEKVPAGNRNAFLAFSAGGRSCVGYKLAKKQICIIFVELLRKFEFETIPGFQLKPESIAVSQKHMGGIPMIISKRM